MNMNKNKSLLCVATAKAKIACRNDKNLLCALGFKSNGRFIDGRDLEMFDLLFTILLLFT